MTPLKLSISPLMIVFKNATDEIASSITVGDVRWSEKGFYYVSGTPETLYEIMLELSRKYDLEVY